MLPHEAGVHLGLNSPCSPPGEMVRQARILAQATSDLVNAIKADAEGETDLENSRKLLSAAKILADATAKMVEAAKVRLGLGALPEQDELTEGGRQGHGHVRPGSPSACWPRGGGGST